MFYTKSSLFSCIYRLFMIKQISTLMELKMRFIVLLAILLAFTTTTTYAGLFSKASSLSKEKDKAEKKKKEEEAKREREKQKAERAEKRKKEEAEKAAAPKEHPNMAKSSMNTQIEQLGKYCPLTAKILDDPARCKRILENAQKRLDRTEPQNQTLEQYATLKDIVEKTNKNMSAWSGNAANAASDKAEEKKQTEAFKTASRNHGIIGFFWSVKNDAKYYTQSDPKRLISDYNKGLALEKEMLEPCKSGAYSKASVWAKKGESGTVEATCDVVQNWKIYFNTYMEKSLKVEEERIVKNIGYSIKNLEEKGTLYPSDMKKIANAKERQSKIKSNYSELYKLVGKEMPADFFASIVEASKPFQKTLNTAGKQNRWNKKNSYQQGSVTAVFKRALKGQKLTLIKTGLVSAVWGIIKNNYDLPTHKIRTGEILVKAKGEKFCRIYRITARAQYAGGGKYAAATASLNAESDGFVVSRCK
jgi:hypothetical protein